MDDTWKFVLLTARDILSTARNKFHISTNPCICTFSIFSILFLLYRQYSKGLSEMTSCEFKNICLIISFLLVGYLNCTKTD